MVRKLFYPGTPEPETLSQPRFPRCPAGIGCVAFGDRRLSTLVRSAAVDFFPAARGLLSSYRKVAEAGSLRKWHKSLINFLLIFFVFVYPLLWIKRFLIVKK